MALFITLNDGHTIEWHVTENCPEIWQPEDKKKPRRFVTEVQADGHELEFLQKKFQGIPMVFNRRIVTWFGSDAQFIVVNL